jgi:hypothetical protein
VSFAFASIDELINAAADGPLDLGEVLAFCRKRGASFERVTNEMALIIARRFDSGAMPYEQADRAVNRIWRAMVEYANEHPDVKFWNPAYCVYEAFDAGELFEPDVTKQGVKGILSREWPAEGVATG